MRLVLAHVKMGRWIPKRCNPFPSGPRCTWDVLLESRRNGNARTVSIRRGGWRRGVCAAVAPGEGAAAPGAGAWSWGGDESPIYGEAGGRQVHGRTNDFTGCGTASTGWRSRLGVLWFSAALAQPAGNEKSGPPGEGCNADAVPAGNAGYVRRSPAVESRVYEARLAGDVARD